MKENQQQRVWIPYFVLLMGLLLTISVTFVVRYEQKSRDKMRFQNAAQRAARTIEARMELYMALLRSTAGFFLTSETITREQFSVFIQRLRINDNYPGIQGIGFASRVKAEALHEWQESVQQKDLSDFAIRPMDEPRPEYFPIYYIEPQDRRNRFALGYDMFSESVRREAMERARDTGMPAASGRVTLIQEIDPAKQSGFLLYMPYYGSNEIPQDVATRREWLKGFVYAPFRMGDLFEQIFDEQDRNYIQLKVYDGPVVEEAQVLYEGSQEKKYAFSPEVPPLEREITIGGRPWTLVFSPGPQMVAESPRYLAIFVFGGGLLTTFLLFGVTQALAVSHSRLVESARALSDSENRFRTLFEQSPLSIQIFDAQGEALHANAAWEEIWGVTRQELTGYNVLHDPQLEKKGVASYMRRAYAGETVKIPVLRYDPNEIGKPGRARWVESMAYPVMDEERNVREVVLLLMDVTESREVQENLRLSESRFRKLFESNLMGLTITSFDGRVLEANETYLRMTGFTRQELDEGKIKWTELTPAKYHEADLKAIEQIKRTGSCTPYEKEYLLRNGHRLPILVGRVLLDGSMDHTITFVMDLTELRKTERNLREAEVRAQAVLDTASDAVITCDKEGRVVQWNPAAEIIFGYSSPEVIGSLMTDLIIPAHLRSRHQAGMQRMVETRESKIMGRPMELTGLKKDGTEFPVEIMLTHFTTDGQLFFTAHLRDITERKKAEEALKEAQQKLRNYSTDLEKRVVERTAKLQEINEALESFTYSVSHDLKAPVRSMQGFATLLKEENEGRLSQESLMHIQRIVNSAQRMDRLIHDLLEYSRLARLEIALKPVPLAQVVAVAVEQQQTFIEERHAVVTYAKEMPVVLAHDASLVQAVSNLISNAIKFVPPDRRPQINIRAEVKGEEAILSVEDNGIGIAPQYQDRIFKVFERLNELATPGTGIGLAAVYKMMERMNGSVGVESTPGKGSRFYLSLRKV